MKKMKKKMMMMMMIAWLKVLYKEEVDVDDKATVQANTYSSFNHSSVQLPTGRRDLLHSHFLVRYSHC